MVDVLSRVTASMMKEAQERDVDTSKIMHYVKSGRKPTLAQIRKVKSRPVQRYLCQFDRLLFRQGVLHRVYEQDGAKYLSLPSSIFNKSLILFKFRGSLIFKS